MFKRLLIILENCSKLELLNVCYLSLDDIKENFIVNLAKKLPGRLVCLDMLMNFKIFWRIVR